VALSSSATQDERSEGVLSLLRFKSDEIDVRLAHSKLEVMWKSTREGQIWWDKSDR